MHRWQQVEARGNRWCQSFSQTATIHQQESGADTAAKSETRTEIKRIHFLLEWNLAGRKVGDYLQLRVEYDPAASGPVRMLWFVV